MRRFVRLKKRVETAARRTEPFISTSAAVVEQENRPAEPMECIRDVLKSVGTENAPYLTVGPVSDCSAHKPSSFIDMLVEAKVEFDREDERRSELIRKYRRPAFLLPGVGGGSKASTAELIRDEERRRGAHDQDRTKVRRMTEYVRYRDFIADLKANAAEDDTVRVLENRYLVETCDTWLSLLPGWDGGVALIHSSKNGRNPADAGVTIKIAPTVMMAALAAALSRPEMMDLARSILKAGDLDLDAVGLFSEGLKGLPTNPFDDDTVGGALPAPIRKPPSLDIALWRRIPHAQRPDFIKKMAMGVRRGVHPDDTVSRLLG